MFAFFSGVEVMVAGACDSWSYCICSQEIGRDEWLCSGYFLLLMQSRTPAWDESHFKMHKPLCLCFLVAVINKILQQKQFKEESIYASLQLSRDKKVNYEKDLGKPHRLLVGHNTSAFWKQTVNRIFESEKPQGPSSVTYYFQDSTF